MAIDTCWTGGTLFRP